MKRSILMACLVVAAFAGIASAESIEECESRCRQQYEGCMAPIASLVNDIEKEDAKAVCDNASNACNAECMAAEQNHQFDPPPKANEEGTPQQ